MLTSHKFHRNQFGICHQTLSLQCERLVPRLSEKGHGEALGRGVSEKECG